MSDPSLMSDLGGSDGPGGPGGRGSRRAERPRRRGGLFVLLVLVLVISGVLYVGIGWAKDHLGGPADYPGPGKGQVSFTVAEGETVPAMGRELKQLDVVKSVDAFVKAASRNSGATGIQPGGYTLKKQMRASDAVKVLVDPSQMQQDLVTIPEGVRAAQVVDLIAQHTDFSKAALTKVLANPASLGLPAYAHGSAEGYLFPATYQVKPDDTPQSLLKSMVTKWREETSAIDLESAARAVNLDPDQVMTVASILEFEAQRSEDYPKVARAIYNRLKKNMPLQSDATVAYANNLTHQVWTTAAQRGVRSAYNTYQHPGLPPGPIGNPGIETIKAALHPVKGPWLYWVVVNLRTGETVFSTTYAQHQAATRKLQEYCKTSSAC